MIFCTVITQEFLPRAMTLHASLEAANPGAEFYALIVDAKKGRGEDLDGKLPFKTVFSDELCDAAVDLMSRYYNGFEFTNALRSRFIKYLFSIRGAQKVVYLDSDIYVTGSFKRVEEILDQYAFSYTPHVTKIPPFFPEDNKSPRNMDPLNYGFYNSGFQAYRRCEEAEEILDFLAQRLRFYCFDHPPFLFGDQKWLDVVAGLFGEHFYCLKDPAYNVAYWNLHERPVRLADDAFYINGERAVFFHLSGFDPRRPTRWTAWPARIAPEQQAVLAEVLRRYVRQLNASKENLSHMGLGMTLSENGATLKRRSGLPLSPRWNVLMVHLFALYLSRSLFKIILRWENQDSFRSRWSNT